MIDEAGILGHVSEELYTRCTLWIYCYYYYFYKVEIKIVKHC